MAKEYYVYIMANRHRTIYTGVTNDLLRRVYEHKCKLTSGFTSKYDVNRLVYLDDARHSQRDSPREADQGVVAGEEGRPGRVGEPEVGGFERRLVRGLGVGAARPSCAPVSGAIGGARTLRFAQSDSWGVAPSSLVTLSEAARGRRAKSPCGRAGQRAPSSEAIGGVRTLRFAQSDK